jgi:hypothetical protein
MPRAQSYCLAAVILVKDIAALPPDAAKVAPNDVKAMTDSVAALKGYITSGDYRAALMGGRGVSSRARDLALNLNARRIQITAAYNAAADVLPKELATLKAKVDELSKARRLPAGIDPAKFAAVKAGIETWSQEWAAASQSFKDGDIAIALSKANEVKAKVADGMKVVGLE